MDDELSTIHPRDLCLCGLHQRHPGLTEAMGTCFCEAASVCFGRYHVSPTTLTVTANGRKSTRSLHWKAPDQRTRRSQGNKDDAVRDGAYAVALLMLEAQLRLVAIGRIETHTGADWVIAPPEVADATEDDLPNLDAPGVVRLEVSGTDRGGVQSRLTRKQQQLAAGGSSAGLAAIVGFQKALVLVEPMVYGAN